MRLKIAGAAVAAAIATASAAAQPAPPKLIVAISIDQFSADLYDEYRPHFTAGLERLSSGIAFRNGYQSHNATETCPGHSTILTGARPSRTGIIANYWFDLSQQRSDKAVYCAEDERVPGSSSIAYTVSPYHLRVPTLGDLLKRAQPGSRNVAVAGKDRSAVMMGGHAVDQRWYWDGKTFVTDLKAAAMPQSVAAAKTAVANAVAQDRPALEMPAALPGQGARRADRGRRPAGRRRRLRPQGRRPPQLPRQPRIRRRHAGAGRRAARGNAAWPRPVDRHHLDRPRRHRLSSATAMAPRARKCASSCSRSTATSAISSACSTARAIDYLVVLTADHGGQDIPERKRVQGVPGAARVDAKLTAKDVGAAVGVQLGLKGPVLYGEGSFGDMYVDRALSPADRARAKAAAVAAFRAHPQVEAVFTDGAACRDSVADLAARQMEPDRARPGIVRSRTLGRLRRAAEARHHARSPTPPLCRDPWQPLGL